MNEIEAIFGAAIGGADEKSAVKSAADGAVSFSTVDPPKENEAAADGTIPTTEPMCRLAQYILDNFIANADERRRSGVDDKLRYAIQAQTCQFTAEQREKMRRSGVSPDVFVPITSTKVRAAKAMLVDIFQSSGDWPFTLSPTPDPEVPDSVRKEAEASVDADLQGIFARLEQMGVAALPPAAMNDLQRMVVSAVDGRYDQIAHRKDQYAISRAKRMEKRVQDIMAEGGWVEAFNDYVNYICTYGTGIILGPIPRVVPMNRCKESKYGTRTFTRELKLIPTFEAVNPVDCYPAPDAKSVNDGPLCIRVRYNPAELRAFADAKANEASNYGREGWNIATLQALLGRYPKGGCKIRCERRDETIREAEKNSPSDNPKDCLMEGIRCFASVRGSDLIELGIYKTRGGKAIKSAEFYDIEALMFDDYVVYCRIIDDRLGRPVSKGVFYEVPGSWWGESVADKCRMVQNIMNNCIKALMQNMAVASGPMYYISDVSRLVDKSPEGMKLRPHKVIGFTNSMMGNAGAPLGAVSVPSNASELMAVFEKMRIQADDDSGIPAYTYGQSSGQGALRTASGLAIFTEAASRGMKMVIGTTDRLVTRDQVRKICNYILIYDNDVELKGDCEIVPAGVMGKILKAQQDQQRLQFLNMAITNPMLQQIFGAKGIVALLRPSIQDLAINPDDCLPSAAKLEEIELLQKIQQLNQAAAVGGEAQGEGAPQGAPPGVEQPPPVQSGVAERRAVA